MAADLEHNLLHLLIRALELSDEDQHHLSGVVVGREVVHQRDQVANGFEEGGQALHTCNTTTMEGP